MSVDETIKMILKGVRERKTDEPFDATKWALDVGEMMWRGLVEPCVGKQTADISVSGHLRFRLTEKGKRA